MGVIQAKTHRDPDSTNHKKEEIIMTAANSNDVSLTAEGRTPPDNGPLVITGVLESEKAVVVETTKRSLGSRYVTHREEKQPDGTYTLTFYLCS